MIGWPFVYQFRKFRDKTDILCHNMCSVLINYYVSRHNATNVLTLQMENIDFNFIQIFHSFCFVLSLLCFRLPFVFHHFVFIKFSMDGNRNRSTNNKHYEADFMKFLFKESNRNECVIHTCTMYKL